MNAASEDIKDILEGESSLGLIYEADLFIGFEPDKPDDVVTIFDTPSRPPQLNVDPDEDYFYSAVQIRVRSTSYDTGYTLARNIMNSLHGRAHETWNGTIYNVIQATGEPALMDWDKNRRCRFILNFNLQRC